MTERSRMVVSTNCLPSRSSISQSQTPLFIVVSWMRELYCYRAEPYSLSRQIQLLSGIWQQSGLSMPALCFSAAFVVEWHTARTAAVMIRGALTCDSWAPLVVIVVVIYTQQLSDIRLHSISWLSQQQGLHVPFFSRIMVTHTQQELTMAYPTACLMLWNIYGTSWGASFNICVYMCHNMPYRTCMPSCTAKSNLVSRLGAFSVHSSNSLVHYFLSVSAHI